MRSGLAHLKKRVEPEREYETFELTTISEPEIDQQPAETAPASDLDKACWSLVSFDQIEAGGLIYRQAAELITLLDGHGITGLCVVTDDTAARMKN